METEDAYIYGNYDTSIGRIIRVHLDRCTDIVKNNCKSDDEIDNFITGKFLALLNN